MITFMDHVQNAWLDATRWNRDNSYSNLTPTARALLDFPTPNGLRLHVSSLSSPNLATSYTLGSVGVVDGSISYLYSSLRLDDSITKSRDFDLPTVIQGYRQLQALRRPDKPWWWEIWHKGRRIDRRDTLLYGKLYLPSSHLEALYLRRLSPTTQLRLSCVSNSRLKSGGTILSLLQRDVGKHSIETLYSTDSALLGVRGLYNFGPDPRLDSTGELSKSSFPHSTAGLASSQHLAPTTRFTAGLEAYYGLLNASGGLSTALRYATLPNHPGFPMTVTLTLNPLMGNMEGTYAVKAGRDLSLASRFSFNVYSYESDVVLGCELWRRRRKQADHVGSELIGDNPSAVAEEHHPPKKERLEAAKKATINVTQSHGSNDNDNVQGVLKARIDQNWNIGLLWEGRIKELLFTLGKSSNDSPKMSPSALILSVSPSP
ncbi:MAG: Mitochondrial distribution and morphology protein 10 [Sclerophora amabilis]|nr:MAG: Mitochondrial distribution and morphology protein 10 [Sclerophora amabilis]